MRIIGYNYILSNYLLTEEQTESTNKKIADILFVIDNSPLVVNTIVVVVFGYGYLAFRFRVKVSTAGM